MRSDQHEIKSKVQAIIATGDLCLNCSSTFVNHPRFDEIIRILHGASDFLKDAPPDDSSMRTEILRLRDALIECYTAIIAGVNQIQLQTKIVNEGPFLIAFVQMGVTIEATPALVRISFLFS